MYLLYLDASGTPELTDKNSKHYVLGGVCMRESSWFTLNKRLNGLKRKYRYHGSDFELHVKQFACHIKEQDEIPGFDGLPWTDRWEKVTAIREGKLRSEHDTEKRRARKIRYDNTAAFIHLSRPERSQLLEDAIQIVATHTGVTLFAEAISKNAPSILSGSSSPTTQAFEQVVSRFDSFLKGVIDKKRQTRTNPSIDHGLLILDYDASTESTIEKAFNGFRVHGHSFGSMRFVIDVPFFASSEKVSGLQIVDVMAFVVRRYLDTGSIPGSVEERHFRSIFPKFDRDNSGRLHGIRHYIPAGTCSCLICRERGHSPANALANP